MEFGGGSSDLSVGVVGGEEVVADIEEAVPPVGARGEEPVQQSAAQAGAPFQVRFEEEGGGEDDKEVHSEDRDAVGEEGGEGSWRARALRRKSNRKYIACRISFV